MTERSPDSLELRTKPLTSARLSRKAMFTAIGCLALILGVVIVNVSKGRAPKAAEATANKELQPALNAAQELTRDVPDFVAQLPQKAAEPPLPPQLPQSPRPGGAPVESTDKAARLADTAVGQFTESRRSGIQPRLQASSEEAASNETTAAQDPASEAGSATLAERRASSGDQLQGADLLGTVNSLLRVADHSNGAEPDLNRQSEKIAFLRQPRSSAYLNSRLQAPRSPYELKTGTVIPAITLTAMSSDLPGEIVAQVSQNVYDTATGKYLLIPQGTRLFGSYDSTVSYGQGRALVSWQRLIFPNAYTLELGGMNGHDQAGAAGLKDRINNHYGRVFGWALVSSVFAAGAQLSQPQQANSLVPSNGQVAAAAVGQQVTQVGAQIASRNIQVQPTLEIRKGYRMNVMVNKDIVFSGTYPP
jgi:type IV secretory pathway VirB10-like protein